MAGDSIRWLFDPHENQKSGCSAINITHKHADQLGFTLWADGVEWLADPGLYTYRATDSHAEYFRHVRAHNAVVVDGATYSPGPGNARLVDWDAGEAITRLRAEHSAYPGLRVHRQIEFDRDLDRFLFADRVDGDGDRECASWFHAGLDVSIDVAPDGSVLMRHPSTSTALLVVPCSPGYPDEVDTFSGQLEPFAAGWIYTSGGVPEATSSWCYMWPAEPQEIATAIVVRGVDELETQRVKVASEVRKEVERMVVPPAL